MHTSIQELKEEPYKCKANIYFNQERLRHNFIPVTVWNLVPSIPSVQWQNHITQEMAFASQMCQIETYQETQTKGSSYLVVWEGAIFVNCIDLGHFGTNRLTLKNSFLFSLSKKRNFIIYILKHDEDSGFWSQLLCSVILQNSHKTVCSYEGYNNITAQRITALSRRKKCIILKLMTSCHSDLHLEFQ